MALVDYSSDDKIDSDDDDQELPCAKRRRTSSCGHERDTSTTPVRTSPTEAAPAALPPLPASFHDLYAHTVRTSTVDDPALHQGRRRLIPHKPGHWPSHVYVEWHPTPYQYTSLTNLVSTIARSSNLRFPSAIGGTSAPSNPAPSTLTTVKDHELLRHHDQHELITLLLSTLSVPLPLHISLSRPLSLATAQKDLFLDDLRRALLNNHRGGGGGGGTSSSNNGPFRLRLCGVDWHRTEESGRTFLVLRVTECGEKESRRNPRLIALLNAANDVADIYAQPGLYSSCRGEQGGVETELSVLNSSGDDVSGSQLDHAFHVSIAWTASHITPAMKDASLSVSGQFSGGGELANTELGVDAVKVKIGNVVTNIPLGFSLL